MDDGGDLGQGVVALVDDVVQEGHPQGHQAVQGGPVQLPPVDQGGQVDGAQVAGLVGQEGLLAAGVGGLQHPELRGGVGPLHGIGKDQAGVARGQGHRRR